MGVGSNVGHLPPIDSKLLRKNGEAILHADLCKNGEAILGSARQPNASQATLEQRLNSRASSGNHRYSQMEVGGYQRRYGMDPSQANQLPPRPNYNSNR
jgi:hypothetical protein